MSLHLHQGRGLVLAGGCAGLALLLAGCHTVGPNYVKPEAHAPDLWHTQLPGGLSTATREAALSAWWTRFDDPVLSGLVTEALDANLDLQSAVSRVRQARAQAGISRAGLAPTLGTSGSATHSRTSTEVPDHGPLTDSQDLLRAGFDSSWEIDIFGGVRRGIQASERDVQASEAALGDVRVSLAAEVGVNYIDARTYQRRTDLAEANLKLQKETLDLVEWEYQAGTINELPVQQARYSYESTAARIPALRAGLQQSLNHLATLIGRPAGAVHARMTAHAPIPPATFAVDVGIPSEALRRRPDVRQAERQLAAQTARIGVAVANLYPRFTISGSFSRQGAGTGFANASTSIFSIGPAVSWNLFEGGALRDNVRVQREIAEQDRLAWESAILGALEEVENRISAYAQEQVRRERLERAVAAASRATQLARDQYQAGTVDFTDVLTAEQALVSNQDQLAQSEGAIASDLISLFKALGGGWDPGSTIEAMPADREERTQSS